MIRNDYRRAFIMLRAAMPGYGGHVRLERRTLTGSMYFIITAPQGVGELAAALVGRQDGAYYAAPIGPLARDRRGQLALAWQFDPRDIGGRPLEAYAWVAVVATGGPCALALTGNVEGSREVDVRALEKAACALFAPALAEAAGGDVGDGRAPAADLPGRDEAGEGERVEVAAEVSPSVLEINQPVPGATSPVSDVSLPASGVSPSESAAGMKMFEASGGGDAPGADAGGNPSAAVDVNQPVSDADPTASGASAGETHGDVRVYTMTRARLRRLAARGDAEVASKGGAAGTPGHAAAEAQNGAGAAQVVTAARQLGLDFTAPWPGAAEPLRRLFATQVPAADAPRDGFTYVRVPMPADAGYPYSLAGLSVRDGKIVAVRHALPARRAPEAPAGMDACAWLPGEGEAGFWVAEEGVGE